MDDLISRQAAIDYLLDDLYDLEDTDCVDKEFIEEGLKRVPTVQLEQRTGKWEKRTVPDSNPFFVTRYYCTACEDWNTYGESKFCPKCGAKMERKS